MYISIYSDYTPPLIEQLVSTAAMQRLNDIGMHCGCEYAKFPIYQQARQSYSRLTHSIGVANIVWNFTQDIKQAVAGLLHDIATPVFAHTIDFMHGDHLIQESTEDKTTSFIENSKEIVSLLHKHGISVEDVNNYHKYPIADNDTPMLSADRLEYTLGNGFCVYNIEIGVLKSIYNDIFVGRNEYMDDELCFSSVRFAKSFTEISLRNSKFFVSDEDRFSMQYLADIMKLAVNSGVLAPEDLYLTENQVIKKIIKDKKLSEMWNGYSKMSVVTSSSERLSDCYCVNISAKKRYINPLVQVGNRTERLSEIDSDIRKQIQKFLETNFDKWIYAV